MFVGEQNESEKSVKRKVNGRNIFGGNDEKELTSRKLEVSLSNCY
jgi:hypothetical protein